MLQRKQSLFLLLAGLLAFSTWLFPVAEYESASGLHTLRTYGLFTADGAEVNEVALRIPFGVLLSVIGAGALACILLYGNRPRQMRFIRGTYLLMLAVIAFLFITDNSVQSYLAQGGGAEGHYGLSFYIPLVVIVLLFLAERAVKADEALVRSMDRLR
ncbi:MAG: DUF4293 domain-containing protein [Flavobacteriales bacterium]|nr:DUF4293 domain-containing protein [Flavobacteriales bacterium]